MERIDVVALRAFLDVWLAPLLPPEVIARLEKVRDLGAAALARHDFDASAVAGFVLEVVDQDGCWADWKSAEYQSARALVANAVREPRGVAALEAALVERATTARFHRFAWIVHA